MYIKKKLMSCFAIVLTKHDSSEPPPPPAQMYSKSFDLGEK